jgi:hypothetical protein
MAEKGKLGHIVQELKEHAPFTLFGALLGVAFMLLFRNIGKEGGHVLFLVFHPAHVVLSAMVTAALFRLHEKKARFVKVLIIGYVGAIGVATVSDCIIPFLGESIFEVHIPKHQDVHHEEPDDAEAAKLEEAGNHAGEEDHEEHVHGEGLDIHLGFIEDWYIVNPAALLGVLLGYFWPRTKLPHASHVLISTWASSAHVLMNLESGISALVLLGFFLVLFLAVLLPCCVSDIIFPSLFIKSGVTCHCHYHEKDKSQEENPKES